MWKFWTIGIRTCYPPRIWIENPLTNRVFNEQSVAIMMSFNVVMVKITHIGSFTFQPSSCRISILRGLLCPLLKFLDPAVNGLASTRLLLHNTRKHCLSSIAWTVNGRQYQLWAKITWWTYSLGNPASSSYSFHLCRTCNYLECYLVNSPIWWRCQFSFRAWRKFSKTLIIAI